nr:NTP transferase domain-containing protein [Nocardioides daedukensis]
MLAAGAGRRMGTPKALVDDWLLRSIGVLEDGGCDQVTVVLGAAADRARELLDGTDVAIVEAADWAQGMGASLRTGLAALAGGDAALVSLVDLPDVGPEVVRRVLAAPFTRTTLRRAAYDAVPGHPVLLGRGHWDGVIDAARGDRGARDYLSAHEVELIECADLATGRDVDSR